MAKMILQMSLETRVSSGEGKGTRPGRFNTRRKTIEEYHGETHEAVKGMMTVEWEKGGMKKCGERDELYKGRKRQREKHRERFALHHDQRHLWL